MRTFFRLVSLNAARVIFVGALGLALYAGLNWALNPDPRPDAESIALAEAAREASESEAAEAAAVSEPEEPESTPVTPDAVPTTDAPEVLIAAAKPPTETTVQVLDAGGGSASVDAAVAALESIGYQVVSVRGSSRDVTRTTVYFTAEAQAEADALRARDPRFQVVEPNQGLSEGVDIHVLVAPDF